MRLILAALLMGGLACTLATAAEKIPLDKQAGELRAQADKPAPEKPAPAKPAPARPTPAKIPSNKAVDYGDMRCGFAVRHRDTLDGQIIAWAGGFLDGYTRQSNDRTANSRVMDELTDPNVLRVHIRGYCLKHPSKSIESAALSLLHRPRGPEFTPALGPHPAVK